MQKKTIIKFFLPLVILILIVYLFKFIKINNSNEVKNNIIEPKSEDETHHSNIIKDVNYNSIDARGNKYTLDASTGEIDLQNNNIVFLKNVRAYIELVNGEQVTITSNFGKYNINNYDTIFSKNVIINYLKNKITGDYLDFSLSRNSMIISKNVIYKNEKNILKADVIEMNIRTKDTKIFMYEKQNKVKIQNRN